MPLLTISSRYLHLPLPLLSPFPLPLSIPKESKLVHSLVPIVRSLQGQDRRSKYQREEQLRSIQLPRKQ